MFGHKSLVICTFGESPYVGIVPHPPTLWSQILQPGTLELWTPKALAPQEPLRSRPLTGRYTVEETKATVRAGYISQDFCGYMLMENPSHSGFNQ